MSDMTPGEIERKFGSIDRRFADTVHREVYEANITELRLDVQEIKEGQRWVTRLIAAQFVGAVIALAVWAVTSQL